MQSYTHATKTCEPSMALPSASGVGNAYEMMTCITPYARQVPTDKTLTFLHLTRGLWDHATDEELSYELSGCALSGVSELSIVPSEPPVLTTTFHVGKIDQAETALANETFVDAEQFAVIDDNFRLEWGVANATTPVARGDKTCFSATVKWGFKTVPIISEGSGTFAGIQGYMQVPDGPATVSITSLWDYDWWSAATATNIFGELEADNSSRYIGLVQPTTAQPTANTRPAFAFWMPNAHLIAADPASVDFSDEAVVKGTATFEADCAGYDGKVLNSEAGAAPWAFAISGVGA